MLRWFNKVWEGSIEPAWIGDAGERQLLCVLNVILAYWELPWSLSTFGGGSPQFQRAFIFSCVGNFV